MFYSPELLSRNGPLALVWQAAHSRGGLPEARMKALPLLHQVEQVLSLQMQVYALPLRAKLLLGCSRVYASKASLLLKDSSRTLDALRSASDSRSSSRQRPASQSRQTVHTAPEPSINLPQDPSLLQLFQLQVQYSPFTKHTTISQQENHFTLDVDAPAENANEDNSNAQALQQLTPEKSRNMRRSSDRLSLADQPAPEVAHDEEAILPPAPNIEEPDPPELPGPPVRPSTGSADGEEPQPAPLDDEPPPMPPLPPEDEPSSALTPLQPPEDGGNKGEETQRQGDQDAAPDRLKAENDDADRAGALRTVADDERYKSRADKGVSKKRKRRQRRKIAPEKDGKLQMSDEQMKFNIRSTDDIVRSKDDHGRDEVTDATTDIETLFKSSLLDSSLCFEIAETLRRDVTDGERNDGDAPERLRRSSRRSSLSGQQQMQLPTDRGTETEEQLDAQQSPLEPEKRNSFQAQEGPTIIAEEQEKLPPVAANALPEQDEGNALPPLPVVDDQDDQEATARRQSGLSVVLEGQAEAAGLRQSDEDRQRTERTESVARYIDRKLASQSDGSAVELNILLQGKSRMQASRMFFEVMLLGADGSYDVSQVHCYGDILINRPHASEEVVEDA